ncbi:hypothetical protein RXV86_15930 [Alisedimentitalea sp. MJ-SS2]|uniref:hypothetical protein n=1 Tax=Aliisedimentitalea sp. MJ-SS2 TaxID=3049795 RepID=UPI0029079956|nr:hypothetical protein [Alisedimentitalea sp. MJ-SS2]MDU8928882.1 hypothetical protein [Alisedimentitalea sp. MJ-SS2]
MPCYPDGEGRARCLGPFADSGPETLSPDLLARLGVVVAEDLPLADVAAKTPDGCVSLSEWV